MGRKRKERLSLHGERFCSQVTSKLGWKYHCTNTGCIFWMGWYHWVWSLAWCSELIIILRTVKIFSAKGITDDWKCHRIEWRQIQRDSNSHPIEFCVMRCSWFPSCSYEIHVPIPKVHCKMITISLSFCFWFWGFWHWGPEVPMYVKPICLGLSYHLPQWWLACSFPSLSWASGTSH